MKPFPIFLIGLDQRRCIVIGGGREGQHKVKGLLDCEASVTVISPDLTADLRAWAEAGTITWLPRDYQPGDLQGAFLVIAERAEAERNAQIWAEAETEGALVNVMDDVGHCNFVAGSVVRQGPLTMSISTSGAAPALAVRLRERFEAEFGPEYRLFLEWMRELREPMAQRHPDFQERRRRWYELIDSEALALLREGHLEQAGQCIAAIADLEPAEARI
jgi:precorrin-2 dehydrogenase/sirohydrochlorin ferrochelatase